MTSNATDVKTKESEQKDASELKIDQDVVETELEKLQNFGQESLELSRNGILLYICHISMQHMYNYNYIEACQFFT